METLRKFQNMAVVGLYGLGGLIGGAVLGEAVAEVVENNQASLTDDDYMKLGGAVGFVFFTSVGICKVTPDETKFS